MFGFVVADTKALSEDQLLRYRGAYCGLCRTLNERHGIASRLTLNYDMTFLILLLNSMYEPEEHNSDGKCLLHPIHGRSWWRSKYSDYAADMNIALAYYNSVDDWADDKNVLALAEMKALEPALNEIRDLWPRQISSVERCIDKLRVIEQENAPDPDLAANCFGTMMGDLFACEEDPVWGIHFRSFGEALGRFVYMMDACIDFEKDRKHHSYNPLSFLYPEGMEEEEKLQLLKMLISECTSEFEKLPLVKDVDILRSVLYSGVWTQYAMKQRKEKGDPEDDQ